MPNTFTDDPLIYTGRELLENQGFIHNKISETDYLKHKIEQLSANLEEVNQLRDFLCKSDPSLDLSNGTINTAIKEIGNAKASILILQTELAILKNSQKA